jgi:hypothetical protein
MKWNPLHLLMVCCLSLCAVQANSQKKKTDKAKPTPQSSIIIISGSKEVQKPMITKNPDKIFINPFQKGTINITNKKNLDYTHFKHQPDRTTISDMSFNADANYFFMDGFAVGADIRYSNYKLKPNPLSTYNYLAGYINLTYGRQLTERVGAYFRLGGGIGHSKSTLSSNNSQLEADYVNIHGTIGVPIALIPNSPIFLTPVVTYNSDKTKIPFHKIRENGYSFGVKLESYFNSNNNAIAKVPAHHWPQQGTSFIEYNTDFSIGNSTRKESQGETQFADVKNNNFGINAGYHYYFLDYLAGGLNISFTKTGRDNSSSVDKRRIFRIQPAVTVHAPVEGGLRDLFLQVAYGFEHVKNTGSKENNKYFSTRIGYNLFLTQNISLSPKVGYESDKYVHHTAGGDYKSNDKGLATELGLRIWLNYPWIRMK